MIIKSTLRKFKGAIDMKKILILIFLMFFISQGFCEDKFKWARVKFLGTSIGIGGQKDNWDVDLDFDLKFLMELSQATTVKPEIKVYTPTLEKLEEITKYPILFMHAETITKYLDIEIKNMREYCLRGGFIWQDDCVLKGSGDYFFRSFKKVVEEKVFPGKKMVQLQPTHEIFHCHFDMPEGLPYCQGPANGAWGLSDDKGRLMILSMSTDLHCGWKDEGGGYWGPEKTREAYRMGINIVVYALTH